MSLMNILSQVTGDDTVTMLSRQLGTDPQATSRAVAGALPMLVGALAKNTGSRGGAESLLGALDRDHDGSILDDVMSFVGQGSTRDGEGILGHVLGGRKPVMEQGLSRMSGLDQGQAGKLLAMLAPLVLGALGRQRRQQSLDSRQLADLLGQERERATRQAPDAMGLFGKLLDADGDGDVMDDVARIGGGLLGGFLKGR